MMIPSISGSKYWLILWKSFQGYNLLLGRNEFGIRAMVSFLKDLKVGNQDMVKILHYNNSGENKSIQLKFEKERSKVHMEFTAPNTPQAEGKVEGNINQSLF
jgi:hypothetical protein